MLALSVHTSNQHGECTLFIKLKYAIANPVSQERDVAICISQSNIYDCFRRGQGHGKGHVCSLQSYSAGASLGILSWDVMGGNWDEVGGLHKELEVFL